MLLRRSIVTAAAALPQAGLSAGKAQNDSRLGQALTNFAANGAQDCLIWQA